MKLSVLLATCLVTLALAFQTTLPPTEALSVSRALSHRTSTALGARQFIGTDEWLAFYGEVVEKKCAAVVIVFAAGSHPRGNVGDMGRNLFVKTAEVIGRRQDGRLYPSLR